MAGSAPSSPSTITRPALSLRPQANARRASPATAARTSAAREGCLTAADSMLLGCSRGDGQRRTAGRAGLSRARALRPPARDGPEAAEPGRPGGRGARARILVGTPARAHDLRDRRGPVRPSRRPPLQARLRQGHLDPPAPLAGALRGRAGARALADRGPVDRGARAPGGRGSRRSGPRHRKRRPGARDAAPGAGRAGAHREWPPRQGPRVLGPVGGAPAARPDHPLAGGRTDASSRARSPRSTSATTAAGGFRGSVRPVAAVPG